MKRLTLQIKELRERETKSPVQTVRTSLCLGDEERNK